MDSSYSKQAEWSSNLVSMVQTDNYLNATSDNKSVKKKSSLKINSNHPEIDLKLANKKHLTKSCNCITLNEGKSLKSLVSNDSEVDSQKLKIKSRSSRNLATPPDGGWGWIIVFISFMINLIADGITASFGLVFIVLNDYFQQSKSKTAWVGSLFISIPLLTGPLASALTDRYGCRRVTIVSGLLAAAGFILGYFATRLEHLFVAFSISGFGLSLCFVTSLVIVAYYFEKRRSFSTGLAVCGTGVGATIFAPFTTYLLKTFSWRGTFLVFSGFFLNIILFGAFMRDLNVNEEANLSTQSCDYCVQPNQELPVNKSLGFFPNFLSFIRRHQNFSSLVDIPTFIQNDFSFKVISSSTDASDSKTQNFKNKNKKICDKKTELTFTYSLKLDKKINEENDSEKHKDTKLNNEPKNLITKKIHLLKKHSLDQSDLEGTTYLKVKPRLSITYRNAMLNIRPLMASSAPNLYHHTTASKFSFKNVKSKWRAIKSMLQSSQCLIDFSVFKSFRFSLFCFSNLLLSAFIEIPYIYLPDHINSFETHDKDLAFYLISIIGIVNTLGTIITGYIGDKPWISPSTLYGVLTAFSGIAVALIQVVKSFKNLAILGALFGFSISANYSLVSAILVDLISLDKFTNAYGLLLLIQGIASLIGPPFAGWLRDISGNYDITFILSGICIFISGVIIIPVTRSKKQITDTSTIVSFSSPSSPNDSKISNLITHTSQQSQDRLIN